MLANWFHGRRGMVLLSIAALAGALAGIYFSVALYSNNESLVTAECVHSPAIAARLEPFVTGELAAFSIAEPPERLENIAFNDPAGEKTSLAAFEGRTILVNLWATWCVPCRQEMPALDNLEAALGSDDFEVVAIDIDLGDPARAHAFLDEIGVEHLKFYSDPTAAIFSEFKKRGLAFGLPATLLIDESGCRVGSVNGPAEWDSESAKLLIKAALEAG